MKRVTRAPQRDVNGWKKAGLPWNHWGEHSKGCLAPEDEKP
ncbi:hypothetical protein [Sphaerotilus microaerophilus]|nr:hypothetical protein [Sphaerotilus sp. FB-5]